MKTIILVAICTIAYVVCMDLFNNYMNRININNVKSNVTYSDSSIYSVKIQGNVLKPGSYVVTKDSTLGYLITLAGGLTDDADITAFNSNITLENGETYYISYKRVNENNESIKVSINNASEASLDTLPGIGEVFAKRIIEYRTSNGSFKRIEDLKKVKGIGESLFDSLKDLICL